MLASREAGDLLDGIGNDGPYRYFAIEPAVFSRIAPLASAATVDEFSSGEEMLVVCYTDGLGSGDAEWLRLENGSYVPGAEIFLEFSSSSFPADCKE